MNTFSLRQLFKILYNIFLSIFFLHTGKIEYMIDKSILKSDKERFPGVPTLCYYQILSNLYFLKAQAQTSHI